MINRHSDHQLSFDTDELHLPFKNYALGRQIIAHQELYILLQDLKSSFNLLKEYKMISLYLKKFLKYSVIKKHFGQIPRRRILNLIPYIRVIYAP